MGTNNDNIVQHNKTIYKITKKSLHINKFIDKKFIDNIYKFR
jgi:hypothetical protein